MPQITVGSANINTFGFSCLFNLKDREVVFDTAGLTTYNGSGINNVQGISFLLQDQDGVELTTIDFSDSSKYIVPSVAQEFTLDLSSLGYAFLFQTYKIVGAIKDQSGDIYYTTPVYKKICEPVNFNESGYVPGIFQVTADCINNVLTVQELTNFSYNNTLPVDKVKDGIFYYPTGTISPISFENTPFTNNVVYTGENRVVNTTTATYDLGDDVFVDVDYITDNAFPVTCNNSMLSVMCCILDLQNQYEKNCNNAVGLNAQQKLNSVTIPLIAGLMKEIAGQDASSESVLIRKTLNCSCGDKTIKQNEPTPINPSVYNIVIQGVGGTSVPAATIVGSTKTYNIASNVYQVVKGDTGDLAYTITTDTSTAYTVKYKLTFNYNVMADYILTQFEDTPAYVARLQALIGSTGVDLTGLDGKCIIDLSSVDYAMTQAGLSGSTTISNIVINGNTYNAPGSLFVTNTVGVANWLNSLTLGTFMVVYNTGTLTIISNDNTNSVSTLTISNPEITIQFQSTTATLVQVLQAIIDYLCSVTALQVALAQNLQLCYFDYNGNVIYYNYTTGNSQSQFNSGVASVICNIVSRINSVATITCTKIKDLFAANPSLSFNVSTDKILSVINGNCIQMDGHQLGLAVMNAVNSFSDVKALFCGVSCSTPGICPDISANNASIVSGNIGIYGVSFATPTTSSQTLTVRYRVNGSSTWIVATNNLQTFANGNVSGSSPYLITGLSVATTYDLWISNNCGGAGFVSQITTPTSTVYSGSYLLDNVIYNICGSSTVTLYSSSPFGSGVTMYSDIGLTTPVTGYTLISANSGNIFQINSSTGVVGIDTGNSCSAGTSGTYILGDNTGTICANSEVTRYTNGVFASGGILYNDAGLTSPVTGYFYVVNLANNMIYHIDNVTGQIGLSTGLSCSASNFQVSNGSTTNNITDVSPAFYSITVGSLPLTPGSILRGTHTGYIGVIDVVDTNGTGSATLTVNDISIECINLTGGTNSFASRTYNSTDRIKIFIFDGVCGS